MNEKIGVLLVRLACAEIGQDWNDAQVKASAARRPGPVRKLWERLAKWWGST
jgi:hypothetical protein